MYFPIKDYIMFFAFLMFDYAVTNRQRYRHYLDYKIG